MHLRQAVTDVPSGSGDTTFAYVDTLGHLLVSLAGAALWSAVDRRPKRHDALQEFLRIYVRYCMVNVMFGYGMSKVLKSQFPKPDLDVLTEPYGESSPMRLMWTFMGYSTPYTVFAGLTEVASGALLLTRRTTIAGALLGAAVMGHVALMNLSYDIPVKLFSIQLFLIFLFLLAPDFSRLANILVHNRAVAPAAIAWPWPRFAVAHRVAKTLYITILIALHAHASFDHYRTYGDGVPRPALYGMYEPDAGSSPAVRRIFVTRSSRFVVELTDKSRRRYLMRDDGKGSLNLTFPNNDTVLHYRRLDETHLDLDGPFEQQRWQLHLRRISDGGDFLLMNRGFHWINEFPLNR